MNSQILKALKEKDYMVPTPIQSESIPVILQGKDILGSAQTGTGKTAAFALPILQNMFIEKKNNESRRMIKTLVLAPTRELALQIHENFIEYGKYVNLKSTVIYGGVSQSKQVKALKQGVDILIATPGRLLDLIQQGIISLSDVSYLVLDEADRMLDMGFVRDVKKIVSMVKKERQTMFFSATMPKEIMKLANEILSNPVRVQVAPVEETADKIKQFLYYIDKKKKNELLVELLKNENIKSVLVFSRTKHGANRIVKRLDQLDIPARAIHGNKSQTARQEALLLFKAKKIRVLVATDIAARGIDIDELSHVINFDLPEVPETYIHRIGRTGRAGFGGVAISFCSVEEVELLKAIEKHLKTQIPVETISIPLVQKVAEPKKETFESPVKKDTKKPQNKNKRKKYYSKNTNQSSKFSDKKNKSYKHVKK